MPSRIVGYCIAFTALGILAYLGVNADRQAFVGSLYAAFFTALVAVFVESELRPQIRISRETNPPFLLDGRKFLRVIVENRVLWWPLRLIMDRRPAYQVRARITFLNETNDPLFSEGRHMIGRWANTPEPVRPISMSANSAGSPAITFLWDLGITRDAVDIGAGGSEILDIVMRVPGEDGCRGWHNRMIQHPKPPPENQFELPKGRYHVLVHVEASGRIVKALFRIVCNFGIEDFRLEPLPISTRLPKGF